ncbi:hypothetical protein LF817_05680 [Halobacillus sp. A1]|uniref:hypothetical protein n=1 Tax=Halobacillus sp. A1 TaxID=2880262 RepID=UPI0020A65802|nr:hypothetical protein [Halobacillus sp. A1]MCP3030828.1 hypothetical protein [Halobacillus sp. A1]
MQQINLFEIGAENEDPLYIELKGLNHEGERKNISVFNVHFNQFGLYEIESDDIHVCFHSINECYSYLRKYV